MDCFHLLSLKVNHEYSFLSTEYDNISSILLEKEVDTNLVEERLEFVSWNLILYSKCIVTLSLKYKQHRLLLLLSDQCLSSHDG